jgi:hypothetical protein
MSDPCIWVINGNFSSTMGILCFLAKLDDMNECDAPESNNTIASTKLTKNSPSTTPEAV